MLAIDVSSLMRIHSFLEHWGLINFGIDPRNRPSSYLQLPSSSATPVYLEITKDVCFYFAPYFHNEIINNYFITFF